MTVPSEILSRARAAGLRVASAESCTGGLVAAALTSVPGSSHMFERGFVTYSNASKRDLLGVRDGTLERYGAVSEEVAREMAEGALTRSGADVAISTTGIAGPGASEYKPEGRVCFGTARKGKATQTETVDYGAIGRETVRARSCEHALALLFAALR